LDDPFRRVVNDHDALLSPSRVQFLVRGSPVPTPGFGTGMMVEICDAILSARESGRLKKKQLELACGYEKVRSMQMVRLELQVCIADRVDRWALPFPAEFRSQTARLEGWTSPPQPRPLIWSPHVLAFVYDAVDAEVHCERRRHDPDPRFANDRARWLDAVGPERVADRVVGHIAAMKTCGDMDEFDSAFANVLMKHRLDVRLPVEPA